MLSIDAAKLRRFARWLWWFQSTRIMGMTASQYARAFNATYNARIDPASCGQRKFREHKTKTGEPRVALFYAPKIPPHMRSRMPLHLCTATHQIKFFSDLAECEREFGES